MKKKVIWFLIIVLLLTVGYTASLSDPPLDDSEKFVDIESYLNKKEMIADIDTLIAKFEKIHPNPYRFEDKNQFTSRLDSIKKSLSDTLTTIQFWRIIDQVISSYTDAHSYADDGYILTDYVKKGKLFFPLAAKIHNEKIIVSKNDNFEQLLPQGAEIQKINNVGAEELISELTSHSFKETHQLDLLEISEDFGFYLWKAYDWDSEFKIHYYKNNKANTLDSIKLKGLEWEKRKSTATEGNVPFSFKFLEEDIGYMKINDFNGEQSEINDFYDESFNKTREKKSNYLILDFRGHEGGADSYGEDLAKYISKEPFRKLSEAYWKITPEFKEAFDKRFIPKSIRWFKPIYLVNEYSKVFYGAEPNEMVIVNYELKDPFPEDTRFQGEVFLITDHNTFSAGSIFAEMFKYYNMGLVVGEPTGNLHSFNGFALTNLTLPNSKLSYQISSVYNIANNREEGLKTVEPDYFVDSSEDPLQYILENFIR